MAETGPQEGEPRLTFRERTIALRSGLNPSTTDAERVQGYVLLKDGNRWVIVPPASHAQGNTRPSEFDAGICEGHFIQPHLVGTRLEWGAWDSCKSTAEPNDLYVHELKVSLRQQNPGFMRPWHMTRTLNSRTSERYSRAITVHGDDSCADRKRSQFPRPRMAQGARHLLQSRRVPRSKRPPWRAFRMIDHPAIAFRSALDAFRTARDSLVAVMEWCHHENVSSGRDAASVAVDYQISLHWAEALTSGGSPAAPEELLLAHDLALASFACELTADPDARTNVVCTRVLTGHSLQITSPPEVDDAFIRRWTSRAATEGLDVQWNRGEFSMPDVVALRERLVAGAGGPAVEVSSVRGQPTHALFQIAGSERDRDDWVQGANWPSWAELLTSPQQ